MSGRRLGPHMDISRLPSTRGGLLCVRLAVVAGCCAAEVPDGCRPAACLSWRAQL